jgi:hypothetical protein
MSLEATIRARNIMFDYYRGKASDIRYSEALLYESLDYDTIPDSVERADMFEETSKYRYNIQIMPVYRRELYPYTD